MVMHTHTTCQLMMTYHDTKFNYKRFIGSKDIIPTNVLNLYRVQRDIIRVIIIIVQILNLGCAPDHDHSNPVVPQDALAYDGLPLKFSCQIITSSEDTVLVQTVIFWLHDNPSLDLHLEDSTPCFLVDTPQPMMLQHNTRFGYKRCCGSELKIAS